MQLESANMGFMLRERAFSDNSQAEDEGSSEGKLPGGQETARGYALPQNLIKPKQDEPKPESEGNFLFGGKPQKLIDFDPRGGNIKPEVNGEPPIRIMPKDDPDIWHGALPLKPKDDGNIWHGSDRVVDPAWLNGNGNGNGVSRPPGTNIVDNAWMDNDDPRVSEWFERGKGKGPIAVDYQLLDKPAKPSTTPDNLKGSGQNSNGLNGSQNNGNNILQQMNAIYARENVHTFNLKKIESQDRMKVGQMVALERGNLLRESLASEYGNRRNEITKKGFEGI